MIKHYFKIAWQSLLRHRLNSVINISGLSIGMAASLLIFMWVTNEVSFDRYHKDAKNIYRLKNYVAIDNKSTWVWENSPYLLGSEMEKKLPEVLAVTRVKPLYWGNTHFNIKGEFIKETQCAYVDSQWFSVFDYDFVRGSAASFNAHPFSLVLTESKAEKYFGNDDPIGKTIRIDTLDYEVRAVVKDIPSYSSFQYDVLIPQAAWLANPSNLKNDESWGNFNYITFVKLRPQAIVKDLPAKITSILSENKKSDNIKTGLISLADMHFENDLQSSVMEHGNKNVVIVFSILGVLLLLIACINYVNLVTARASLRAKEVSIKKITGAGRGQLFFQFVIESVIVSFIAVVITMLIVKLVLPSFNQFTEKNFVLSFTEKWFWMIVGGTFLASVLLTSIYPALLLSSFKPIAIFRGFNALKIKDATLRKGLVVTQFTIAIVLIIGTIVIYRQLKFINSQNSTYDKSQVLSFNIPYKLLSKYEDEGTRSQFLNAIKAELLKESSIKEVSCLNQGSVIDMQGYSSGDNNDWDGRDKEFMPGIGFFYADNDFKTMLNLEMAEGRWYEPGNTADLHNSILNETAIRELNIRKPVIGQRFVCQGDTGVIIGVVKDFYYKSMHEKIGPVVIRNDNNYNSNFLVKSEPGKIMEAQKATKKVYSSFFSSTPFVSTFLDEEFAKLYRADRKTASLVWLFSAIAIFLSCLGLFGLAAFTAERRTKEIGVRKVLGASVTGIVALISKEFVALVVISMLIASPVAWWAMTRWLEDFSYRINISVLFFILAGMITLLVAIVTVSVHAVKAAITNPVKSLRTE
ncbi:MAG TPA: ABC transporter permease [Chitinophagaceae bacterium]